MTRRKTILLVAGAFVFVLLLSAVGFVTYFFKSRPAPKLTITLLNVDRTRSGYTARVAVTNVSGMTLQYHQMRRSARIRVGTKSGWITNSILMEPFLRLPVVLHSGSNDVERVRLPNDAIRLQLQYTVPPLSPIDSFRQRFPKASPRVQSLVSKALSNKPGEPFEIESEVFQIPQDLPPWEPPAFSPERRSQRPFFPDR